MVFIHMLPYHLHFRSQSTYRAITTRFTDDKTEFQQYLRKVHLQNGHITNHNLTQIGKLISQASGLSPNLTKKKYTLNLNDLSEE